MKTFSVRAVGGFRSLLILLAVLCVFAAAAFLYTYQSPATVSKSGAFDTVFAYSYPDNREFTAFLTGLVAGDRIELFRAANVRTDAVISASTLVGVNMNGARGTIVGNVKIGVSSSTWYNIDFDIGHDGWVVSDNYAKIKSTVKQTTPSRFKVGDKIRIFRASNIRSSAAISSSNLKGVNDADATGVITAGPTLNGTINWYNVNFDTGFDGWTASDNLLLVELNGGNEQGGNGTGGGGGVTTGTPINPSDYAAVDKLLVGQGGTGGAVGEGKGSTGCKPNCDSVVNGGGGNNVLNGTPKDDEMNGFSGDDVIYGREGHDSILGSTGNDVLIGGGGNDVVIGHSGNDTLYGGLGRDTLYGEEGCDRFVFYSVEESLPGGVWETSDIIKTTKPHTQSFDGIGNTKCDLIDLRALGDLTWGGNKNQLNGTLYVDDHGTWHTSVYIDKNRDGKPEMEIVVYDTEAVPSSAWTAADFIFN